MCTYTCEITLDPQRTRTARSGDPESLTAAPGTRLGLLFPVGLPGSWPVSVTPVALGSREETSPTAPGQP